MNVRIVIQARMGSTRLPGKSVAALAGRPLLARVVQRAQAMSFSHDIVVATSTGPADDAIEALASALGAGCIRGDEQDVLSRFAVAAEGLGARDTVVRMTADNPLYEPVLAERAFSLHVSGNADYTYVQGLSHVVPEFIRVEALLVMAAEAREPGEREHVTPWLRAHAHRFTVCPLEPSRLGLDPALDCRLTVDTPRDHERLDRMLREMEGAGGDVTMDRVYSWLARHDELVGTIVPGARTHESDAEESDAD